jgi:short-subunit dehydrogenase
MEYKTALVTGASSGMGRGLALWLAARGIKVYAAGRRLDRLRDLAKESAEGNIEPMELDVALSRKTVEQVRELDDACGGLDLIVANAGLGHESSGKRIDWDKVEQVLQVNVMGAAATLSAVLPRMCERKRGHLVGVSSIAAHRGLPKSAAYNGSKAFLTVFCQSLRLDVERFGVRVTTIHPGFVKTEMTSKNKFPMPFLLEADDAVNRMGRAILKGKRTFSFPFPLVAAMELGRALPGPLFEAAVKNLR